MLGGKSFNSDILMVNPKYFRVEYRINPYMSNENGELNKVDTTKAIKQWDALLSVFVGLNLNVSVLEGDEKYPDMVFVANQSFPFKSQNGPALLMSKMNSSHRQGEVSLVENWARENGIETFHLSSDYQLEGTGDMIWDSYNQRVFGGHGFRTDSAVYDEVEKLIDREVIKLKLVSSHFYHLDTCFSVLSQDTVLYVPEAFDEEGKKIITSSFKNTIEVSAKDSAETFVGNCFSPDGKNVISHTTTQNIKEKIESFGFNFIEVDTSEFMKSGGSVFCMKLALLHAH